MRDLLGDDWPKEVGQTKLARHSFLFDEAICWCRQVAEQQDEAFVVEVHLHGGFGVAAALRELLARRGWQEQLAQSREAFDLLKATSPLAARVFAARRDQAWQRYFEDSAASTQTQQRSAREAIQVWNEWGKLLLQPPTLLLAGPPNAGKSTLFNAWLQEQRVTANAAAGTTRDLVSARCNLGVGESAFAVELTDSAGVWEQATGVDLAAVQMTRQAVQEAWRVIWVFDASVAPNLKLLETVRLRPTSDLLVVNRSDLPPTWDPRRLLGRGFVASQRTQHDDLVRGLQEQLLAQLGPPPPVGQLVAFSDEERAFLEA